MKNYITTEIVSEPGIQRDGTTFDSKNYIGGQWCRFYNGKPRKIGGFKNIDFGTPEIMRDLFNVPKPNSVDTYIGRPSSVGYINFDFNGLGDVEINRTPVDGSFVPNENNVWDFDLFTDTQTGITSYIVAHVAQNGNDISNTVDGNIYYGSINDNTTLVLINDPDGNPVQVSGGIVFSSPVLVAYGDNGYLRWSAPGDITSWPVGNNTVVANTKIVKAYRSRGSSSPQILIWSLSSLLSATYVQVDTEFTFVPTTIQDNITIISPDCIIEFEQQFFWIGIDQFFFFNGIVQSLPNTMSSDWFFQNVNLQQRSKIWGIAIPRYKELWWFYPKGDAIECTDVLIYNTELKTWYDSVKGRSAGVSSGIFPFPLMSDTRTIRTLTPSGFINTYGLWMHEYGVDKVYGTNTLAIESYYETHIMTLFASNGSENRLMRSRRIEPDFVQSGEMTVTVNNQMFANSAIIPAGPYPFDPTTEKIDDVTSQGRLVSFLFTSNVAGGYYQAGKSILNYEVGDVHP